MRVILFHDEVGASASSDERDVVVQMDAIAAALAELGHESVRVPCTLNLAATGHSVREANADLVFNLVESIGGQGRLIALGPSLLEAMGVPFTGCPGDATFITSCKPLAKKIMKGAGIPTPDWWTLQSLGDTRDPVRGRFILKSAWEHASRGIDDRSVIDVTAAWQLSEELRRRLPDLAHDGFTERYIEGREFNLSLLCGEVLPPAEILFEGFSSNRPRIVGYSAKWDERSKEYSGTPRRFKFPPGDRPLLARLEETARACWGVFGLRGYARVDFRVDHSGLHWVLEVNSNPCLSPDAGFAAAVAQAGLTYTRAIERIVNDALSHTPGHISR